MTMGRAIGAVARLDLAEAIRSRWLAFCFVVYGVLAAIFVFIGLRESTVMGFTGMGRVLMSFFHVLVLVLPLLALTATAQVVPRACDDGGLELLLTHPVSRRDWLLAVTTVRYLVLVLPLVMLISLMTVIDGIAFGRTVPLGFLLRSTALSASLLFAFVGIGILVSTLVRDLAKATMLSLLAWVTAVAFLDIALLGVMLQLRLNARAVFLLASLNPVQAARMALLSGVEPELSVLGPVGFYLAHRVGANGLLALGVGWPLVVGAGCLGAALRRFKERDLV